jgi:hypothetical protein
MLGTQTHAGAQQEVARSRQGHAARDGGQGRGRRKTYRVIRLNIGPHRSELPSACLAAASHTLSTSSLRGRRSGYRAAKRVELRSTDLVLLKRRQHPPRAKGLRTRSLALSETPCTWRRPLYGTWEFS